MWQKNSITMPKNIKKKKEMAHGKIQDGFRMLYASFALWDVRVNDSTDFRTT
jgi:hypothetical protein